MNIRIALEGSPGALTGSIAIGPQSWRIATWARGGDNGHANATTDGGEQITLALDSGAGAITIGRQPWHLFGCRWDGRVMTGTVSPGVTDEEMARMFPGLDW